MINFESINSWLAIALLLYIFELISFTGFFFWVGNAALVMWVVNLLIAGININVQLLLFSTIVVVNVLIWRHFMKKTSIQNKDNGHLNLNRRAESYIGRKLTLDQAIQNGRGKATLDDSIWNIQSEQDYPAGTKVKITSVDSATLHIKSIE